MGFDPAAVAQDFPILQRPMRGKRLVYLDSAATSQKPRQVIDTLRRFYEEQNAPVHRSVYQLAEDATVSFEDARAKVARFVNAPALEGVVFTKGSTEGLNLVAHSWARPRLRPGDEILATVMEHHSNLVPWQLAAKATGATMRYLSVGDTGELDPAELASAINDRTKVVAVTAMSNVLGTIVDVRTIADAAHAAGAVVVVDGAQYVPHAPADFDALGADFLVFSGHKMLGPTGIGALVARPDVLESMDPFLGGGEMIRDVTLEGSTWADVPYKFEGGTQPVAEAVAFGAAIDYLEALGMEAVREHEVQITRYAVKALLTVPELTLYGPHDAERRGAALSFNVGDGRGDIIHPHDFGQMLDAEGVAIRAGHHCARPLMRRYDVAATCRASCYVYNTESDIDALVEAVEKTRKFFAGS